MIECSIVIPTFNRPGCLKRILSYYNDFKIAYNIIVADSSSDDIKKINKEAIPSFSNLKITYLDSYSSEIYPLLKVSDALNRVDTRYCVFCADDDFITPNGIKQSIDFLADNPDFAIAHGYYIRFTLTTGQGGKCQFLWGLSYSHDSIVSPTPEARLSSYLSHATIPTLYAVYRTDLLQMFFKEALKNVSSLAFNEIFLSLLTFIYGKMKCLDILYAAREVNPFKKHDLIVDHIRDGTYDENYQRFRECLVTHLSKQSQKSIADCTALIDKAFATYMNKKYFHKAISLGKVSDFLHTLHLPGWMNKGLRILYRKIFRFNTRRNLPIDFSNSSKYYDDFERIRQCVMTLSEF